MFILIFWNQYEISIIANRAVALSHVGPAFFSFFFYTIGDAVELLACLPAVGLLRNILLCLYLYNPSLHPHKQGQLIQTEPK